MWIFDLPATLTRIEQALGNVWRQNQTIIEGQRRAARQAQREQEQDMALGTQTLAAIAAFDKAISDEVEQVKQLVADKADSGEALDAEFAKVLTDRLDAIKGIVPDKAQDGTLPGAEGNEEANELDPAADPADNPPPADNPDVTVPEGEQRPLPGVGETAPATDAPGNTDAPGSVGEGTSPQQ